MAEDSGMHYLVLGTFEVGDPMRRVTVPQAPKTRQVLALLVLRANQVVLTDSLIDELWPECPPASAMTTLQTYIYQIRKVLRPANGDHAERDTVLTKPNGYLLSADPGRIDAIRFETIARQGRESLDQGNPVRAAALFSQALQLWRSAALADVTKGPLLRAYATRLDELRIAVTEQSIEANLAIGRHQDIIADLRVLTVTHQFHERFHAFLMTALQRAGRRCEALEAYQRLRHILRDNLGIEPSHEVRRLHQSILTTDL